MTTFIIATRNAHKVQEIRDLLRGKVRFFTLDNFIAAPPVREDGNTFEQNAAKKSVGLAEWLLRNKKFQAPLIEEDPKARGATFVLADDSGLEVDALDGAPGVHSARYAHLETGIPGNAPDAANNHKLLTALKGVAEESRTARFRCVLCLTPLELYDSLQQSADLVANGLLRRSELFDGVCEGRIAFGASGAGGFGYDPLFIPAGHDVSFAELGEKVKNRLSHRAQALAALKRRFAN